MSPRSWRRPTCVGLLPILAVALAACTVATPRLAPPTPASLAAVRGLTPHACNATTASVLDALGIPPAALRSIYYERPPSGTTHGTPAQGYNAWVRLAGRPGDLVVRHDDGCRFITSYTRGAIRLGR